MAVVGDLVTSSFPFTPSRPVFAVHSHLETAKKKKTAILQFLTVNFGDFFLALLSVLFEINKNKSLSSEIVSCG